MLILITLFICCLSFSASASPTITINFAGNMGDWGGPYWQPPGETQNLSNINVPEWRNGYYTNDSRQHEDWIYINLTVNDTDGVDDVWLHWLNDTTWNNNTWQFINTGGDYWEFNSSGNITNIACGYNYSFDIWANNSTNVFTIERWNKTILSFLGPAREGRRFIQLNCTQTNISYIPFYLYQNTSETGVYFADDFNKRDRLHHDQGADGSISDTGYLINDIPTDERHSRRCGSFIAYYFEDSVCIDPVNLTNIYFHIWYSSPNGTITQLGSNSTRRQLGWSLTLNNYYTPTESTNRSRLHIKNGEPLFNNTYLLTTHLLNITSTNFTDNSIYELFILGYTKFPLVNPSIMNNRSFTSFVLFNIPDNATLNASHPDTDGDSLSDWTELYVTYTNPFLGDTDNDGANDYLENYFGSDPNNYTSRCNVTTKLRIASIRGNIPDVLGYANSVGIILGFLLIISAIMYIIVYLSDFEFDREKDRQWNRQLDGQWSKEWKQYDKQWKRKWK